MLSLTSQNNLKMSQIKLQDLGWRIAQCCDFLPSHNYHMICLIVTRCFNFMAHHFHQISLVPCKLFHHLFLLLSIEFSIAIIFKLHHQLSSFFWRIPYLLVHLLGLYQCTMGEILYLQEKVYELDHIIA